MWVALGFPWERARAASRPPQGARQPCWEWGREARHYEFSCPSQVNSGHKAPRLEVCVNVNVLCVFCCRLHITHKTEKALLIDSF